MIHILDTEHPWDVHSINSEHSEAITCLEWDQSGEGLGPTGLGSGGARL
jgi:mediator of RNA polymerase II transcription subunit 16